MHASRAKDFTREIRISILKKLEKNLSFVMINLNNLRFSKRFEFANPQERVVIRISSPKRSRYIKYKVDDNRSRRERKIGNLMKYYNRYISFTEQILKWEWNVFTMTNYGLIRSLIIQIFHNLSQGNIFDILSGFSSPIYAVKIKLIDDSRISIVD